MLFYLSQWLLEECKGTIWADWRSSAAAVPYITVRSAGAAITALVLSWWLGPKMIAWLRNYFGQSYRDRAETHGDLKRSGTSKQGTPTMGGLLIVFTMNLATLLWAQWNTLVQLTLLSVVVLAALGFCDDYQKVVRENPRGVTTFVKLTVQTLLGLFIGLYLWAVPATTKLVSEIMVPFYKYPVATGVAALGILITVLAVVGSSNAVNLTDGLDGLAIGCTTIVSFAFLAMTYLAGNFRTASYLQIPYVPGAGELTVFCAALIGAGMGFLWYNCHPAQVFMGDTGSLALGGALGIMAVLIHQPFVLLIAGGVFVMEAGSVILQVLYFKYTKARYGTGQRLFLMSPLHHHFEKKNWHETQVVIRFYILCVLFVLVALSTLKIR
ncbi:MAG: phospho-N-acetylmuramoyl-pentapeptide-transferase [Verrucomicrobiales bacterium]|nr:phospho-N-acetylmuramoyl-pentapeptide-transferase [Verrucomicrobiales bacterium]